MSSTDTVPERTAVTFELQNRLPLFREVYASAEVGTIIVTGIVRQHARLYPPNGSRLRIGAAQRFEPGRLRYPLRTVGGSRSSGSWIYTDRFSTEGRPPLATYSVVLDDREYRYKQQHPGRRGYDVWDGTESCRLATTHPGQFIEVHVELSAVALLLIPWLDNQVQT